MNLKCFHRFQCFPLSVTIGHASVRYETTSFSSTCYVGKNRDRCLCLIIPPFLKMK